MIIYLIITISIIGLMIAYQVIRRSKIIGVNSPTSPLHGWSKGNDLKEPKYAPWNELLSSKLVNPHDIRLVNLDKQGNYLVKENALDSSLNSASDTDDFDDFLIKFKTNTRIVHYKMDDLVFIRWRSPQESWDHLAGAEGYVVISIKEKQQVDFIATKKS